MSIYLTTQLPLLRWGEPPSLTTAQIMELFKADLTVEESQCLENLSVNHYEVPKTMLPEVLESYYQFEFNLRDKLRGYRKAKSDAHFHSISKELDELLEKNPLEVEKSLLKWRWEFIEDLKGGHWGDFHSLCCYYLQLLFLERYAMFNNSVGEAKLEEMVEMEVQAHA